MTISNALQAHLADWGLRRFDTDSAYDQWQRATLKPDDLATLLRLSGQRQGGADVAAEIAFYDYAAQPHILPVLYSQRYDYYLTVGSVVAERFGQARTALDVGCGIGVLTTFYARQFPHCVFTGMDRSPASIAAAQAKATAMGLTNVRFECLDVETADPSGPFDLIMATQALLQTEQDPGLPSKSWQTFERAKDAAAQADFEQRTGLGGRLDRLCRALAPNGRMIICEKTMHLARRVPFQRALAARGLALLEPPLPIQYCIIEERTDDGPLYVLGRIDKPVVAWNELPEQAGAQADMAALKTKPANPGEPLYENHTASAQQVWTQLPGRKIFQETTKDEPDGRQVHIELGESQGLTYLYCANTFDQRQIVMVKSGQTAMLAQYYQELVQGFDAPA
jgi:SAM-dependent methyltransferase